MSDKLRAAAQAALLALKCLDGLECAREEIEALEAALAEQEQEPMHPEIKKMYEDFFDKCFREQAHDVLALTSLPMEKVRKPLTDEEIDVCCLLYLKCQEESPKISGIHGLIRAVERHHGIGVEDE